MDDAHKYAYRQLLFWAMNDIRTVSSDAERRQDPVAVRRVARAGPVANWLHNLAGFPSVDFEGFDEDRFWREYAGLIDRHPDVSEYREWFDRRLKDSRGPAGAG